MVFRSHPQLIQTFFNRYWFGPPPRVTGGSAWPWIDHPASGLPLPTKRAVRTRFRFGSAIGLTWPTRATRRLIMQKASSHPERLLQLEGEWVQVLFHSPRGVLFTFPSRYWFAIGRRLVFSLGGWALRIQTGFHVSRPTWDHAGSLNPSCRGLSPAAARLSRTLALAIDSSVTHSRNPAGQVRRFGHQSAFARHYLRNHCCFLLLRLLRCFTSPGIASMALLDSCHDDGRNRRVAPFGNLRIKDCMHLPEAYRSLPRPSSPAAAKASAIRPYSLDA